MSEFAGFDALKWCNWLQGVARGVPIDPRLPGRKADGTRLRLAALYGSLPDEEARYQFEQGLVLALESTPPRDPNSAALYLLQDLVSYLTPPAALTILRQRLFSGVLSRCEVYERGRRRPVNLHTHALDVVAAYGVDDRLLELLGRASAEDTDFEFLLTAYRLLSRHRERPALSLVPRALQRVESEHDAASLIEEMHVSGRRCGYSDLLSWYLRNLHLFLAAQDASWQLFAHAWEVAMPPWPQVASVPDSALHVLSFLTMANSRATTVEIEEVEGLCSLLAEGFSDELALCGLGVAAFLMSEFTLDDYMTQPLATASRTGGLPQGTLSKNQSSTEVVGAVYSVLHAANSGIDYRTYVSREALALLSVRSRKKVAA